MSGGRAMPFECIFNEKSCQGAARCFSATCFNHRRIRGARGSSAARVKISCLKKVNVCISMLYASPHTYMYIYVCLILRPPLRCVDSTNPSGASYMNACTEVHDGHQQFGMCRLAPFQAQTLAALQTTVLFLSPV